MSFFKQLLQNRTEKLTKGIPFYNEKRLPSEMISNLHIQTQFEKVVILPTEDSEVTVLLHGEAGEWYSNYELITELIAGRTLRVQIKEQKKKKFFNLVFRGVSTFFSNITLEIRLPRKAYERIYAHADSSSFYIEHIETQELCLLSRNGDISVTNIHGKVEITSLTGNISLKDLSGLLFVNSDSGDISFEQVNAHFNIGTKFGDVTLKKVEGRATIDADCGNLYLEDVHAKTDITTSSGSTTWKRGSGEIEILSDSGDVELSEIEGVIQIETDTGNVDFYAIQGAADIKTDCGDVDFKQVSGQIKIDTDSGNLDLKEVAGGFNIDTYSGDIELYMKTITEDISIYSDCGYITVILNQEPQNLRVKIETEEGNIEENLPNLYFKKPKMDSLYGFIGDEKGPLLSIKSESSDIELKVK